MTRWAGFVLRVLNSTHLTDGGLKKKVKIQKKKPSGNNKKGKNHGWRDGSSAALKVSVESRSRLHHAARKIKPCVTLRWLNAERPAALIPSISAVNPSRRCQFQLASCPPQASRLRNHHFQLSFAPPL